MNKAHTGHLLSLTDIEALLKALRGPEQVVLQFSLFYLITVSQ